VCQVNLTTSEDRSDLASPEVIGDELPLGSLKTFT
jgi:hypothetical protein